MDSTVREFRIWSDREAGASKLQQIIKAIKDSKPEDFLIKRESLRSSFGHEGVVKFVEYGVGRIKIP